MSVQSQERIRVMIVDDHGMVRRGLATILKTNPDLELVGEACDGREALSGAANSQPNVILMDLIMPEMDGTAATREIRQRFPQTQVIALTSFKDKELVEGVLDAGAIGYLLKTVSGEELADAIRAAYAGKSTLAPEATQALEQAERLEALARAILASPPSSTQLTDLLVEHAPAMFPQCNIEIRLLPDEVLLHSPAHWPSPSGVWQWLPASSGAQHFLPGEDLPWGDFQPPVDGLVVAPILDLETQTVRGAVYLARSTQPGSVAELLPAARSLAGQISSALYSAHIAAQTLEHQQVSRELAMAGQIQASFLPDAMPALPGWQIAATLKPARETAGDFYDFVPLPGDRLGLVIADVADKGMGAALYMALCRTLLRTFASEYDSQPERVLSAVNQRILADARAGLFVTIFYAILEPHSGTVVYCNAGHNPPLLIGAGSPPAIRSLPRTGMAVGAVEDVTWESSSVCLDPGETLLLYTDGITDALSNQQEMYGQSRLRQYAVTCSGRPADGIKKDLLAEVSAFAGDTPQFDDITLVVAIKGA